MMKLFETSAYNSISKDYKPEKKLVCLMINALNIKVRGMKIFQSNSILKRLYSGNMIDDLRPYGEWKIYFTTKMKYMLSIYSGECQSMHS